MSTEDFCLSNEKGQQVKVTPNGVEITSGNNSITLDESGGMTIQGSIQVQFEAAYDVGIQGKMIEIEGTTETLLTTPEHEVFINEYGLNCVGKKVGMNIKK